MYVSVGLGEEELSQASDVYAFGICALEVCCVCVHTSNDKIMATLADAGP